MVVSMPLQILTRAQELHRRGELAALYFESRGYGAGGTPRAASPEMDDGEGLLWRLQPSSAVFEREAFLVT